MKRSGTQMFVIFCVALALVLVYRLVTDNNDLESTAAVKVGQAAPEIEGEDVDGVRFKLSDYRGKVVVLDFWGFW